MILFVYLSLISASLPLSSVILRYFNLIGRSATGLLIAAHLQISRLSYSSLKKLPAATALSAKLPNQNISASHSKIIECTIISLLIHFSYYRLCMKMSTLSVALFFWLMSCSSPVNLIDRSRTAHSKMKRWVTDSLSSHIYSFFSTSLSLTVSWRMRQKIKENRSLYSREAMTGSDGC